MKIRKLYLVEIEIEVDHKDSPEAIEAEVNADLLMQRMQNILKTHTTMVCQIHKQ